MTRGLVLAIVIPVTMYVIQRLFSPKPEETQQVTALLAETERFAWHFVASRSLTGVFVIFVTKTTIAGAFIRAAFPTPVYVPDDPSDPWRNPHFYVRPSRVSRYVGMDLESAAFLAENRVNFRIPKFDVASVTHDTRTNSGMGKVPSSGRIVVKRKDGSSIDLILLGTQDGPAIAARLQRELTGVGAFR